jgi:hypothetical protein
MFTPKVKLLFCVVLFAFSAMAQPSNDAGLWCTVNFEKKINKKFLIFVTEEYRRRENFMRHNLFYTDIGIAVKPYDFLKVSLSYRSIEKYLIDDNISFRHRLMLDITLKKKFNKFTFSFRERIQSEVRNYYSSDNGHLPEWYSRNKFELKYELQKSISPYATFEIRYQIRNPRSEEVDGYWHRNRYALGVEYEYSKRHSFAVYYLIQQEYNVSAAQNLYIVGLQYDFSL